MKKTLPLLAIKSRIISNSIIGDKRKRRVSEIIKSNIGLNILMYIIFDFYKKSI